MARQDEVKERPQFYAVTVDSWFVGWVSELPWEQRGAWYGLLAITKRHGSCGTISVTKLYQWAAVAKIPRKHLDAMLDAARADGAVTDVMRNDRNERNEAFLNVTKWGEHQTDTNAAKRVAEWRKRQRAKAGKSTPSEPVTPVTHNVTALRAETETETETKQKKKKLMSASRTPPLYSDSFLRWWAELPSESRERSGRPESWAAWKKQGCETENGKILTCLAAWKLSRKWVENNGAYIEGAHRWLNRRPWDELSPLPHVGSKNAAFDAMVDRVFREDGQDGQGTGKGTTATPA